MRSMASERSVATREEQVLKFPCSYNYLLAVYIHSQHQLHDRKPLRQSSQYRSRFLIPWLNNGVAVEPTDIRTVVVPSRTLV